MIEFTCKECGEPIMADASPGVWVHCSEEDDNYELDASHVAIPDEGY